MPKFRIIIEDEKTGQEYKGYSGLTRAACERIVALVDSVGTHELAAGKLPTGHNRDRAMRQWARDVAHVFDRKPARAMSHKALTIKARKG